jgi:hypothetical protein
MGTCFNVSWLVYSGSTCTMRGSRGPHAVDSWLVSGMIHMYCKDVDLCVLDHRFIQILDSYLEKCQAHSISTAFSPAFTAIVVIQYTDLVSYDIGSRYSICLSPCCAPINYKQSMPENTTSNAPVLSLRRRVSTPTSHQQRT